MAKRQKKAPKASPEPQRPAEIPPGATRKALDRQLDPGGGPPGSAGGPRHAADDVGTEDETFGSLEITRTPASPPMEEEDPMEKGPPYSGRSGGAVGGTPAQVRSAESFPDPEPDPPETSGSSPDVSLRPRGEGATLRLSGFEAIEFAEKQGLLLNKHPDTIDGPRIGLTVAEAEAIADEDPDLIWLDIAQADYDSAAPLSYEPER
jgi:hypothetical protein